MVLRVGLLGAGIFATKAHAPALRRIIKQQQQQQHDDQDTKDKKQKVGVSSTATSSSSLKIKVVAIWSRHLSSAEKLAKTFHCNSTTTTNDDEDNNNNNNIVPQAFDDIDKFLNEVDAIIMALPFNIQPKYIKLVLSKGNNKHLLSEKPIASTVQMGKELLDYYYNLDTTTTNCVCWSVAENYRYEPGILAMADIVQNPKIVGYPHMISLIVNIPFDDENPYLTKSTWRSKTESDWYGGLFVDAFVHGSAMLRTVLGGNNNNTQTTSVSAITSSHADHIPSVDTMTAHVCWKNQHKHKSGDDDDHDTITDTTTERMISGVLAVTFVCNKLRYELQVIGSKGTATLSRYSRVVDDGKQNHGWKIDLQTEDSTTTETTYYDFGGIDGEIIDWLNNIEKHHQTMSMNSTTTTRTNQQQQQQQQQDEKGDVEGLSGAKGITSQDGKMQSTDITTTSSSAIPTCITNNNDSPKEALEDLKFVEACLESGKKNGQVIFIT